MPPKSKMPPAANRSRLRSFVLRALLLAVVALLALTFFPLLRPPIAAPPVSPPPTYADAVAALEEMAADTPDSISEAGRPFFLLHGHPTDRVIVLLHGLANAPAQYSELARQLFDRGLNVVVPRTPYHGEKDLMNSGWRRLTAQQLVDSACQAASIARGLGTHVTVAGLSINGATAAWIAQNRSDVDRAVLLSPFLAPAGLPEWSLTPVMNLLLRFPNVFIWWDGKAKQNLPGPSYVYPRFPTRAVGETMWLGLQVITSARHQPPRCQHILIITTAGDAAANNATTTQLATEWKRLSPGAVTEFQFPLADRVPHDFIDPHQPDQQTALVYPQLLDFLAP